MFFLGVPINELLDLGVSFGANAESAVGFPAGGGLWQSAARVEFDQTLTFATDQVATLPAGFTLNSQGGSITNNVWTPAPGTLALLVSALLTLARPRRRCAWFDRAVPRGNALLQARA